MAAAGDVTGVRGLLEAVGVTLASGGGSLGFDEDGRAAIDAGDGLLIGVEHLPNTRQLVLHAEVGELPPAGRGVADLCRELLHANLDSGETAGATLGVDRESGTVALFARRSAENLDLESLESWLADFADTGKRWTERLAGPEVPDDEEG